MSAKSPVIKRSIVIAGHKTSISLEDVFWKDLKIIVAERNVGLKGGKKRTTLSSIVAWIDGERPKGTNLSCAIRLYVYGRFRAEAA